MKKWSVVLTILILAILQLTVSRHFKIIGLAPDFILIGVVIASLFSNFKLALSLSLAAGALKDVFAAHEFAINSILFPLWSFLVIELSKKVSMDTNLTRGWLVFIIAILNAIAMRIIFLYLGILIPIGISLRIILLESLYTALVSLLVFEFLKSDEK